MFNEICIYEAKIEKQEEIEQLMKEVAAFYMEQDGVIEVRYIKRTHRQTDFNAVKEGAKETGLPVDATASAYGNHYDILKNYDVVVLSPQVQAHLEEVKQDAKEGTKVIATKGAQYIQLTRDPKGAVEFIVEQEKEG